MTYISEEDTEKIVLEHMDHRFHCGKPESQDGEHCLPFQLAMDSLKFLSVLRLANKNTKRAKEQAQAASMGLSNAWNAGLVSGIGFATRVQQDVNTWEPVNPYTTTLDSSLHPSDDEDQEVRPKGSA